MSYALLKNPLSRLLKAPAGPPDMPPGSGPEAQGFQASRRYLMQQLIVWGGGFAAAIIGEVAFYVVEGTEAQEILEIIPFTAPLTALSLFPIELAIGLTIVAATAKYYLIQMDYDLRYYIVTDSNILIRQGVYRIHEATYTFANVQNLSIHQGPIERLFGISTLIVHTAGGGTSKEDETNKATAHRGVLKGISNPVELRDNIQARLQSYRGTGLGDPDDKEAPTMLIDDEASSLLGGIRDELRAVHTLLKR